MRISNNGKFQAFTIIELVISLIISGVVIAISYYCLIFFEKQFELYKESSDLNQTYQLFKKAICHDLESSILSTDSVNEILFYSDGLQNKSTVYTMEDKFIVRNTFLEKDTFKLESRVHKMNYQSDSLHAINAIYFQIKLTDEFVDCIFEKEYSAQELMKSEKILHEQQN
jgi:prepilin-type N-terminal cleavage/methylation domain-containing protein